MIAQVYAYQDIDETSSQQFCEDLDAAVGSDLIVSICGDGGEPEHGWAMVDKFRSFAGNKSIRVVGKAHSMYAAMLCYADDTETISTSQHLVHRAAYPSWYESSSYITDSQLRNLAAINKSLLAAFKAKVDVPAFEAIIDRQYPGMTLDMVFSMKNAAGEIHRPDIYLTAAEAKKIKLIKKVIDITPEKAAKMTSEVRIKAAARYSGHAEQPTPIPQTTNTKNMTLAEFKNAHPEIFAQAVAEGVKQEKDRAGAWAVFAKVDPDAAIAGIKGNEAPSATAMAEMALKQLAPEALKALAKESAKPIVTEEQPVAEPEVSADAKEEADFLAKAGIGKKPAAK